MKRSLAILAVGLLLLLPGAALAQTLAYDDGSFEAFVPLSATVAEAVQFAAPTLGGYSLDSVSFYLQAPAAGPYMIGLHVWDKSLAEIASGSVPVDYQAEGWYTVTLAGVSFQGPVRVGVTDASGALLIGSDNDPPVTAGHGFTFDGTAWTAVTDTNLGVRAAVTLTAPALQCRGFLPPMNGTVRMNRGARTFPLKARLFNAAGLRVAPASLAAAPVVTVLYTPGGTAAPVDVTSLVIPAGGSNAGLAFRTTAPGVWQYNLKTVKFAADGYYTVLMDSGDESAYVVAPTCQANFVIGTPRPRRNGPPPRP
jgi:hypothetical protein